MRALLAFTTQRIEDTIAGLRKSNSEYRLAEERHKELYEHIHPMIYRDRDITLAHCDRTEFREFLDHEFNIMAIQQEALYKQGWLDCVTILKKIGALA